MLCLLSSDYCLDLQDSNWSKVICSFSWFNLVFMAMFSRHAFNLLTIDLFVHRKENRCSDLTSCVDVLVGKKEVVQLTEASLGYLFLLSFFLKWCSALTYVSRGYELIGNKAVACTKTCTLCSVKFIHRESSKLRLRGRMFLMPVQRR